MRSSADIDPGTFRRAEFFSLIEALEREAAGPDAPPRSRDFEETIEVTTTFLGLSGTGGLLPSFLVEEIAQEDDAHPVRRDLLDLFHHRALALLYRSVMQARPWMSLGSRGPLDPWAERLSMLAGVGSSRLDAADRLRILPLLATRRRGALGLRSALRILVSARLGEQERPLEVEVHEWSGGRAPLGRSARTVLGRVNHGLGHDAILGASVPDPGARVVVEIGPVGERTTSRFERGGDLHEMITALFPLFDTGSTALEIELRIEGHALDLALGFGRRLGRDAWLAGRDSERRMRMPIRLEHELTQR
jgi:type VI secretion system protein ImpH